MFKLFGGAASAVATQPTGLDTVVQQYAREVKPRDACDIDQEIEALSRKAEQLLGIEQDLRRELWAKENALREEKRACVLDLKYKRLDPTFLKMTLKSRKREKVGPLPAFAVFSTRSAECKISVEVAEFSRQTKVSLENLTPQSMIDYCDLSALERVAAELCEKERSRFRRYSGASVKVSISTKFTGAIPDEVREKIRAAESSGEFDEVMLIAEVPEWKIDQTVVLVPKGDPLVVGKKGELLWLIDAFDTTPIEEYVAKEFTQ